MKLKKTLPHLILLAAFASTAFARTVEERDRFLTLILTGGRAPNHRLSTSLQKEAKPDDLTSEDSATWDEQSSLAARFLTYRQDAHNILFPNLTTTAEAEATALGWPGDREVPPRFAGDWSTVSACVAQLIEMRRKLDQMGDPATPLLDRLAFVRATVAQYKDPTPPGMLESYREVFIGYQLDTAYARLTNELLRQPLSDPAALAFVESIYLAGTAEHRSPRLLLPVAMLYQKAIDAGSTVIPGTEPPKLARAAFSLQGVDLVPQIATLIRYRTKSLAKANEYLEYVKTGVGTSPQEGSLFLSPEEASKLVPAAGSLHDILTGDFETALIKAAGAYYANPSNATAKNVARVYLAYDLNIVRSNAFLRSQNQQLPWVMTLGADPSHNVPQE